ncbi:MAG: glutamine--fructose-6-phosphate transaminase (isomerizing), partial [Candidatus Omnitrophica bacterium]|nr:glutamine--fructose-6-phosphate transaminase (isomerizing) [Candidatus Omnitrophota bacterium]
MCGIVGYIGRKAAVPVLLEGLKRLEYRGYDSSGIAILTSADGELVVRKSPGKIATLEKLIAENQLPESTLGICHTRWATHGAPTSPNAHPHFDCSRKIVVVHNGIIENYESLKKDLEKKGHKFVSETDTEVVAHLVEEFYKGNLLQAVQKAIQKLAGAFALGVVAKDSPGEIVAARVGSPLIVGVGEKENFIASDVPAILDSTRKIIYLNDGEMVRLTKDQVEVFTFKGKKVFPKIHNVTFSIDAVQKQGFPHFMLKEIHEQPHVLEQMCQKRIKNGQVILDGLNLSMTQLKNVKRIFIVACGTAYHAGIVGKYIIEKLVGIAVNVEAASEFRYGSPVIDRKTLIIAISQSGETADTLAAVKEARSKGAKVVAICNVVGSSLTRESDGILYT